MTPHQWERMSWHARRRYLAEQDRRLRQLRAAIVAAEGHATPADTRRATDAELAAAEARRALALIPPDPNATQHRADLGHALTTRKDRS